MFQAIQRKVYHSLDIMAGILIKLEYDIVIMILKGV